MALFLQNTLLNQRIIYLALGMGFSIPTKLIFFTLLPVPLPLLAQMISVTLTSLRKWTTKYFLENLSTFFNFT